MENSSLIVKKPARKTECFLAGFLFCGIKTFAFFLDNILISLDNLKTIFKTRLEDIPLKEFYILEENDPNSLQAKISDFNDSIADGWKMASIQYAVDQGKYSVFIVLINTNKTDS